MDSHQHAVACPVLVVGIQPALRRGQGQAFLVSVFGQYGQRNVAAFVLRTHLHHLPMQKAERSTIIFVQGMNHRLHVLQQDSKNQCQQGQQTIEPEYRS